MALISTPPPPPRHLALLLLQVVQCWRRRLLNGVWSKSGRTSVGDASLGWLGWVVA